MTDDTSKSAAPGLWQRRSLDDTIQLYADWADRYDADVKSWGYATPARIAEALAAHLPDKSAPVLDFGCGTGLSGLALKAVGFLTVDGTDISAEMIAQVAGRDIYRNLWQSESGVLDFAPGDYAAITATGVISVGAAPPETLDTVLDYLAPGGLLALSYNDATLTDPAYMEALDHAIAAGKVGLRFFKHGPHLLEKDMKSTVYVLERM